MRSATVISYHTQSSSSHCNLPHPLIPTPYGRVWVAGYHRITSYIHQYLPSKPSQSTTSQRPPFIMPPPLFGQLVNVAPQNFVGRPNSEGGNGFVLKDHADGSFDIRYCMEGLVEKNVNRLRITSLNPLVTTARRTNGADVARPSILAPSHQPQQRSSPLSQPPTPPTSPQGILQIIIQSRDWSKYELRPNPLLVHLRDGRSKPRAWLRLSEGEYNKYEKGAKKLVRIKSELERIIEKFDREQWPKGFTPHADLAYAYGTVMGRMVVMHWT
eukprot:scaffold14568_cov91-Skeletonema_dohrnii-CCMP3373.AAC.2